MTRIPTPITDLLATLAKRRHCLVVGACGHICGIPLRFGIQPVVNMMPCSFCCGKPKKCPTCKRRKY